MAEAAQRERWDHTAALMAFLYNPHREKGADAKEPRDFHPLIPKPKPPKVKIASLRGMFKGFAEGA
jgi:hypothetical protein